MPDRTRMLVCCQFRAQYDPHVPQLILPIKTEGDRRNICRLVGAGAFAHGAAGGQAMKYLHLRRAKPIPVKISTQANDNHEGHAKPNLSLPRHRISARRPVVAEAGQLYSVSRAFPVETSIVQYKARVSMSPNVLI